MEEVSLKDLIGIIHKYRLLIAVIAVVAIILSIVYAFLIAVPMYSAQAEIRIVNVNTGVMLLDNDNNVKAVTGISLAKMRQPQFFEQISEELKTNNIIIDHNDLKSIISARKNEAEGTIIISAVYKEKKTAARIVDSAVEVFGERMSDYLVEQIRQRLAIIDKQIKFEETNTVALDAYPQIHKSLNEEYDRLKFAEMYYKGNSNIDIISGAVEPESADRSNVMRTIIIILMAGICIGVLTAFTIEYFRYGK